MNHRRVISIVRSGYPLALLAGLLLAGAFPNIGIAGLAWVAPALMIAAASGKRGWEPFRIGYAAGLAHYLASLYWLLLIPYRWHGIPLGPAAGWLALSGYLALYPAAWVWLVAKHQSPMTWAQRTVWAFSGAVSWVALEMIVARLFSGFPWNLLGASQNRLLPLVQIASITGIYGVAFVVVWTSLSFMSAGLVVLRQPTQRSAWMAEIILPLTVLGVIFSFGFRALRSQSSAQRRLRVTFVQPSIPQTLIWDPSRDDDRFREVIALSARALSNNPTDVLLWPEAAVPKLLRYYPEMFQPVTNLARAHHVWMIIGADDMEPPPHPLKPDDADYFNSSFLISPEGKLINYYRKRGLVIFGEYIPLEHWVPFMKYFTPIPGGFTPGNGPVPFDLPDLQARTSVLICFEDIFPHLAREYAAQDIDFLVNLTNNGWFGESAAQWQHAVSALFRAIENGLPLLRCSNNGLTCWVDSQGRLRQIFRDQRESVYGSGFMTAEVPLPEQSRSPTFYHQHGDLFGWICVAVASIKLLLRIPWKFRRASQLPR